MQTIISMVGDFLSALFGTVFNVLHEIGSALLSHLLGAITAGTTAALATFAAGLPAAIEAK